MIISVRRITRRLKLVIAFVVLTICLYYALSLVMELIRPVDKYKDPSHGAVQVFLHAWDSDRFTPMERLELYYWIGE